MRVKLWRAKRPRPAGVIASAAKQTPPSKECWHSRTAFNVKNLAKSCAFSLGGMNADFEFNCMYKRGHVYILTNEHHTVLYTGVTGNLVQRVYQHLHPNENDGHFTARYNLCKLVYFAEYPRMLQAISEEKRIKAGSRAAKIRLIESINPQWEDLWLKYFWT
jgi:putative endonuclease